MTIDGVNSAKTIMETAGIKVADTATIRKERANHIVKKMMNSIYEDVIRQNVAKEDEISYLPKESKTIMTVEKMARKDAKVWIKQYREEYSCSKKEAKAAFEAEFGYKFPGISLF